MRSGGRQLLTGMFSIDLRSLALFRICLGLCLIYEVIDRGKELEAHYTANGVLPASVLREIAADPVYSLHLLSDTVAYQMLLFAIAFMAAVMLLLGWRTRLATVVSFFLLLSLHARNPVLNHNGDSLIRYLLMWGMFLPLGARASLDAQRSPHQVASPILSVGTAGLLLQGFFVYLVVTASKLQYDAWWEGRALYAVLHKASYVRPLGEYFAQFPGLLRLLSHGTLIVEGSIPILLFFPWKRDFARVFAVFMAMGFQMCIWSMAKIGTFQPVTILALFPYLPAAFWDRISNRWITLQGVRWRPPAWSEAIVAVFLLYTVASNAVTLDPGVHTFPEPFQSFGRNFKLDQRWRMFANTDVTPQGWWKVFGTLDDGRKFDLLQGSPDVNLDRPDRYYLHMSNNAWRTYWVNISRDHYQVLRPLLLRYFCLSWNRAVEPEVRAKEVEVIYVQEFNYNPAVGGVIKPRSLGKSRCDVFAFVD